MSPNRQRVNSLIAAQDAFNRKSDRLLAQLRSKEITIDEYESKLEAAREILEEARDDARAHA